MLSAAQLQALTHAAGSEQPTTEHATLWAYGMDNSRRHAVPDAVIFANNHAQVQAVIHVCHAHHIPLTARGRGTAINLMRQIKQVFDPAGILIADKTLPLNHSLD